MRKTVILFFAILMLVSCRNEKEITTGLIGKWKLVEILMDPGDGSGTFHPIESKKTVDFHADGTVSSNGSLCFASSQAEVPTTGTYTLNDSTIVSADCRKDLPLITRFRIKESILIIDYPCIEPCSEKYLKQ